MLLWTWVCKYFFGSLPWISSVQFSHSVVSDSLWPPGLQHTMIPCLSLTPRACSNSCPSSPTISSSVVPFSSCLQSFPASGSFLRSQFFASGGQSIGASASVSVLPMNIQDWFPLGLTGLISSYSKVLSRVLSIFLGIYPGVEFLDNMVILFNFLRNMYLSLCMKNVLIRNIPEVPYSFLIFACLSPPLDGGLDGLPCSLRPLSPSRGGVNAFST